MSGLSYINNTTMTISLNANQIVSRIVDAFDSTHDFRLKPSLIFLTYVGSASHNTYVPKDDPNCIDDIDLMGVVIPPIDYRLGLKGFEHWTWQHEELDVVLYSFDKFARLLLKQNPNVLGLLYQRPEDYLISSREWDVFRQSRSVFASQSAHTSFAGYANAQLHKMTAFDEAVSAEWDTAVKIVTVAGWDVDKVKIKESSLPMPNYTELNQLLNGSLDISLSVRYMDDQLEWAKTAIQKIHARHMQGYMGEKRKALVRKHGYDTKNAAHLIRLLRMANEFLRTGTMQVFRTDDAHEIRDIKSGRWTLDQVKAEAERLFAESHEAKQVSALPHRPNELLANRLVLEAHLAHYQIHRQVAA